MAKYYIDACIWRDYFEDRKDRFRPLGDWALRLINKIIEKEDLFIISNHLINELLKEYSYVKLKSFFDFISRDLIIEIKYKDCQVKEAYKIKNKFEVPFGDALHVILARDTNSLLITRDKHFIKLESFCEIKKPEDLL